VLNCVELGVVETPNIRLHLPEKMEDNYTDTIVHPEDTKENVIPRRYLTSTATTRAISWISKT
jgi:hypothetical protein